MSRRRCCWQRHPEARCPCVRPSFSCTARSPSRPAGIASSSRSPLRRASRPDRGRGPTRCAMARPSDAASVLSSDLVRTHRRPRRCFVAHSYGGAVIPTNSTRRRRGASTGLVYVAGLSPAPARDRVVVAAPACSRAVARSVTRPRRTPRADGTTDLRINPDRLPRAGSPDLPESQAALMAVTQRPVAQEALLEPSGDRPLLEGAAGPGTCSARTDRDISRAARALHGPARRAHRTIEIPGASHAVSIAHPQATATCILDAAAVHAPA